MESLAIFNPCARAQHPRRRCLVGRPTVKHFVYFVFIVVVDKQTGISVILSLYVRTSCSSSLATFSQKHDGLQQVLYIVTSACKSDHFGHMIAMMHTNTQCDIINSVSIKDLQIHSEGSVKELNKPEGNRQHGDTTGQK